jgi:chromosome partitioning protein
MFHVKHGVGHGATSWRRSPRSGCPAAIFCGNCSESGIWNWESATIPLTADPESPEPRPLELSHALLTAAISATFWLSNTTVARIIAIANQKGGVGKTTTAINLGAALAKSGSQTLVIDFDPQANTTAGMGFQKDHSRRSIYHAILLGASLNDLILHTSSDRLYLVPSEKNLVGATLELAEKADREQILDHQLQPVRARFDYILIDCPPALDLLTVNALAAADSVLIPVQCEYFALEGVSELLDTLIRIRRSHNSKLAVEGILLTMYDERTNLSQQVRDDLRDFFGDQVFKSLIPRNVRLAEAPSHGKPIFLYDPACRGAESYFQLAKEIIDHDQKGSGSRAQCAAS